MTAKAIETPWTLTRRRFMRHRLALVSALLLILLTALSAAAPLIEAVRGIDGNTADLFNRFGAPGPRHWLGTDAAGRDLFIRLLSGGQVSLAAGISGALLSAVFGTAIGLGAGYFGGWPDRLLMRITDGVIALPLLPLLIVLAAVDPTKVGVPETIARSDYFSLYRIVVIISLVGWTTVARLVRAETLSLRRRDYVLAARAQGARSIQILRWHILPNLASTVVVATTLTIGNIILFESVLSFLGLGIQPPVPSWGNMLTAVQDYIWDAPMLAVWPGLLIFVTVIAFNFLGDGLQDALDPRADEPGS